MSNYTQVNNYTAKDSLASGDPNKVIKGSDVDAEFSAISTAIATKANDSGVVHTTGSETVAGDKIFSGNNTHSGNNTLSGSNTHSGTSAFTGLLDVQKDFRFSSDISPSQITSDQNDYNPTNLSTATVLRVTSDAIRSVTGLQGGADGRVVKIINVGSFTLVLNSENASSSAANRFSFTTDAVLLPGEGITLWYDSTSSRWRTDTYLPRNRVLATGSASGAATADIVFSAFSAYKNKKITFYSLLPATTNTALYLRFSSDGGSSYASASYKYSGFKITEVATTGVAGSVSAAQIDVTGGSNMVNTASYGAAGTIELFDTPNSGIKPRCMFNMEHNQNTDGWTRICGGGSRDVSEITNAVRLLMSSGNITVSWILEGSV